LTALSTIAAAAKVAKSDITAEIKEQITRQIAAISPPADLATPPALNKISAHDDPFAVF
jgi:pilus assembly protein TadC